MLGQIKRKLRAFAARHHAVIVVYHSVVDTPLPFPIWQHHDRERFEEQIAFIASNFNCVSLSQLIADVKRGRMQPYSVVVTFDDGYRNNLATAFPILKKHGVPITLFLTTGLVGTERLLWPEHLACLIAATSQPAISFSGQEFPLATESDKAASYRTLARIIKRTPPDDIPVKLDELAAIANVSDAQMRAHPLWAQSRMLTWDEVRMLAKSGMVELGSHTMSHWRLTNLTDSRAHDELVESKKTLEREVGPIRYFAYPHGVDGDFSEPHRVQAVAAGYEAIFTAFHGTVTPRSDITALPRLGIGSDMTLAELDYLLHGGVARKEG
jgi:peptidoglycan/xylan/chitin deacetylase (PgdA/CDA1 family)